MAKNFVTDDLSGGGEGAVRAGRALGSRSWFLHSPNSCPTRCPPMPSVGVQTPSDSSQCLPCWNRNYEVPRVNLASERRRPPP